MSVEVACSTCHRTFPLETHAGLVRCPPCQELSAPRMQASAGQVVEFDGVWA